MNRWSRVLLKSGAVAVMVCSVLVASITRPQLARATSPITHVVIIDEENHSFDDVLGRLCVEQASGALARAGLNMPCDGTKKGLLPDGSSRPLSLEPDYGLGIDHKVAAQKIAMDGGKMDGFSKIHGCRPSSSPAYGCFTQFDPLTGSCGTSGDQTCIANVAQLAEDFAISDRTFEFHATPSYGGHMILGSATSEHFVGNKAYAPPGQKPGPGWGCDSGDVSDWLVRGVERAVPSCFPDSAGNMGPLWSTYQGTTASYVPTIFDRMDAAGVTWKIYGGEGSSSTGQGSGYNWTVCPMFFACLGTAQYSNLVPSSQFVTDAQAGSLPNVSIVTPTLADSAHQPQSMSAGDDWVGSLVGAVGADPSLWQSTAIFITYDDCGCFYDHVNPLHYDKSWGVRVPLIIVSPYARAGYTDSEPATFVSMLAFIEHTFGLESLNPCATVDSWRQACTDDVQGPNGSITYDFSESFDFSQTPLPQASAIRISRTRDERNWLANHPDAGDEAT